MRRILVGATLLGLAGTSLGVTPAGAAGDAELTGRVTSQASGADLSGVCVRAYAAFWDGGLVDVESTTDSTGRYRLAGLSQGSYTVSFNDCQAPVAGYAAELWRDAATMSEADTVHLSAGEVHPGVDASLGAAAQVGGRVTANGSGRALPGICVDAYDPDSGASSRARSGADGRYAITNLAGGRYEVWFQDCTAPYTHVSQRHDGERRPSAEARPLSLAAGSTRALDAALVEGGAVTGTLRALHTGEEIPFACVEAFEVGGNAELAGFTVSGIDPSTVDAFGLDPFSPEAPSGGAYVLGGLLAGRYDLRFGSSDCDGGYQSVGSVRVEVAAGQVVADRDVVLAPSGGTDFLCMEALPGVFGGVFADVPTDNVHAEAISCLSDLGVVRGRDDGTFGPGLAVSRGQVASFVARGLEALDVDLPADPADAFGDDDGTGHERSINKLAAVGILSGRSADAFAPGDLVTRGQMASILVRAYEYGSGLQLRSSGDHFGDDQGSAHEDNINKAAAAAVASGRSASVFAPGSRVQRDQVASFLARTLDRLERDRPMSDGEYPFGFSRYGVGKK